MNSSDDFYIGWQTHAPHGIGSFTKRAVLGLAAFALAAALAVALAQTSIGAAVFEWGKLKRFTGVFESQPYPHLQVQRPGHAAGQSSYYLVAPFKFGLDISKFSNLDGKTVTLQGTLIYRGRETMIEARPDTIRPVVDSLAKANQPLAQPLGRRTLVGEIVDSKCYLGVMNPGQLAAHRACAVRCISGGIPPILLVRQKAGPPLYFLLVSSTGSPVNQQVLDMVAQPVEISGEVLQQGELSILRADPSSYRRL